MSKLVRRAGEKTRTRNATTRLVLFTLASHAGRDCLVWPKQSTIARLCNITKRSVRNALRELEVLGEIHIVTHGQGRGATVYYLDILNPDF